MASTRTSRIADKLAARVTLDVGMMAKFFAANPSGTTGPKEPSKKEQSINFMQMSGEDKQRLFLEMGPERWPKYVDEQMDEAVKHFGAGAGAAKPWFYLDTPEVPAATDTPEGSRATLEELFGTKR